MWKYYKENIGILLQGDNKERKIFTLFVNICYLNKSVLVFNMHLYESRRRQLLPNNMCLCFHSTLQIFFLWLAYIL